MCRNCLCIFTRPGKSQKDFEHSRLRKRLRIVLEQTSQSRVNPQKTNIEDRVFEKQSLLCLVARVQTLSPHDRFLVYCAMQAVGQRTVHRAQILSALPREMPYVAHGEVLN